MAVRARTQSTETLEKNLLRLLPGRPLRSQLPVGVQHDRHEPAHRRMHQRRHGRSSSNAIQSDLCRTCRWND